MRQQLSLAIPKYAMRSFMFETVADLTVYHGGSDPVEDEIKAPFFVSPDMKMAASYAHDRGSWNGHSGYITSFKFRPRKIADSDDIEAAALHVGVRERDLDGCSAYEFISPSVRDEAPKVINELRKRGFDSAQFSDFGMDCPFTEYLAYCVFDPTVLEWESTTPVKA